ncbi:hypothetical protein F2P81_008321 [Scophthalmus maximus]|uniref:Rho-GAP domain-containing protein n=1 Tax=Scophthalmus maximus TaxID=52904 RepID=A0A6A4SXY1_SCOMX|nr:hypothetical protein F2P81_008321 [Scophthalmus maximus]
MIVSLCVRSAAVRLSARRGQHLAAASRCARSEGGGVSLWQAPEPVRSKETRRNRNHSISQCSRRHLSAACTDPVDVAVSPDFDLPKEKEEGKKKATGEINASRAAFLFVLTCQEFGHLDLEGLFLVNGNAERVDWLRQRYDNGEEVELEKEADLASAVSLLRLFLQELPEPVIPTAIQGHILQLHQDYSNEEELCRNLKYLLQQLPQLNYGLLRFLCRFLASVASLQQESWNIGTLAAVFGPDIFHLSTDGEDLRDQESVSRVLAELLDNQEGLFDLEDDDVSTTNDYSSINEQITELLDDDKCEPECEELPQDGEEGPASSDSPRHTHAHDDPAASLSENSISDLKREKVRPEDSIQTHYKTLVINLPPILLVIPHHYNRHTIPA